jgi:hypothetical protein
MSMSLNYFHIDLTERVSLPPVPGGLGNLDLGNPGLVGSFITRDPSLAVIEDYFADPAFVFDYSGNGPEGVQAVFDGRLTNIAATTQSGFDLTAQYSIAVATGRLGLTLAAERLLKNDLQTISAAPPVSILNSYAEPPKWKGRVGAAWVQGRLTASAYLNYVNRYRNTLFTPPQAIDSWTTGDVYVGYSVSDGEPAGYLHGVTLAASINNVSNEQPPIALLPDVLILPGGRAIPFDPANASPVGRFISLSVSKQW